MTALCRLQLLQRTLRSPSAARKSGLPRITHGTTRHQTRSHNAAQHTVVCDASVTRNRARNLFFQDVPLVEFVCSVFTLIQDESYRRRFRSLLLRSCDRFLGLITRLCLLKQQTSKQLIASEHLLLSDSDFACHVLNLQFSRRRTEARIHRQSGSPPPTPLPSAVLEAS